MTEHAIAKIEAAKRWINIILSQREFWFQAVNAKECLMQALDLLNQPSPSEFTKNIKLTLEIMHEGGVFHRKVMEEALDIIDRLSADKTELQIRVNNLYEEFKVDEIKKLRNKVEFLRKRYPEIDEMEQVLKRKVNDNDR